MGREERGVNGGIKKWVWRWPKREEILRNGYREEIGLPMIDAGTERDCESHLKLQKEWRTGDGESDWGMISRVTKRCFGKR